MGFLLTPKSQFSQGKVGWDDDLVTQLKNEANPI